MDALDGGWKASVGPWRQGNPEGWERQCHEDSGPCDEVGPRTGHDRVGQAYPEACLVVHAGVQHPRWDDAHPSEPWTEDRKQRWQQRDGSDDRNKRDDDATDAKRSNEGQRQHDQTGEADSDGQAAEHDGVTCKAHRGVERGADLSPIQWHAPGISECSRLGELLPLDCQHLLAEAIDHEQ